MALFQALKPARGEEGHRRYLLLHNWRTAGTSTSSLLAANFGSRYLKVGMQFDGLGFPDLRPTTRQILTLADVRGRSSRCVFLGGHLFSGLTSFLAGDWQCLMTARDPIKRARSGVLRFHGRPYRASHDPDQNLFSHEGSQKLENDDDLRRLFHEHLRFERNGMCRRLSLMSLAPSFSLADGVNLEKIPELAADFSDADLYDHAVARLAGVKVLILTEHYTASILCLERLLGCGPLLNPFTDGRLNARSDKHALPQREALLNRADHVLAEVQASDLRLWADIKQRFQAQVRRFQVGEPEVRVRDILQSQPLFDPRWFTVEGGGQDEPRTIKRMAKALARRAHANPELAPKIIATVCQWQRLTPETREKLRFLADQFLARI